MKNACIAGIHYCLPEEVETNELLVKQMGLSWSAEDIYQKTGIRKRHIAVEECASDLGHKAAIGLFNRYEGLQGKIDYIIFCSQSADYVLPTTACILQKRLGLSKICGAIDVNQGCSGFIYSLSLAKGLIVSGISHDVLIINAETYSKYVEPNDRSTRTIFGDGAAATWITAVEQDKDMIGNFVFGTDGSGYENLIVHNSGARWEAGKPKYLFMDGPEIFQFTLLTIPRIVKEVLRKNNLEKEEIDYFIFHQANAFILEHLRKKLEIADDRFCIDMEDTGNTVSPSIPIAICRSMDKAVIKHGMKVMLVGFGVGYSWGGCVVKF